MTLEDKKRLKAQLLGKNGFLTEIVRDMRNCPPEQRRERAETINRVYADLKSLLT